MKRFKYIVILAVAMVFSTSCENFLDRPSLGVMDESNFFSAADAGFQAVTQCYYALHDVYGYEKPRFAIGDVSTDDAEKGGSDSGDNPDINDLAYGHPTTSNETLSSLWSQMYKGIGNCNICIKNFPERELVDAGGYPVSEEVKARWIAEIRFLRAYMYFELGKVFGGVPIVERTLSPAESRSIVRATEKETFGFIISELKEIAEGGNLPKKAVLAAAERGRVTEEAAWAMLGKVYMYCAKDEESYLNDAIAAFEHVIGNYSLQPNFQDLWMPDNYLSDEAVFMDIRGDEASKGIYGSFIPVYCCPRSTGAYGFDQPTQNLVDEFEEGDPRLLFTIIQPGDQFPGSGSKTEKLDFSTYPNTGYHSRKAFLVKSRRGPGWGDDAWSYMYIRYADILLLYAEAQIRTNGDIDKAVEYINAVRERANASRGGDVEAVERVLIIPNIQLKPVKKSDDLLAAVKHERRVELAMEQHRFYDLKRWNEYVDRMMEYRPGSFQKGRNELFPIPQVEIDRTEGSIKQNPGY